MAEDIDNQEAPIELPPVGSLSEEDFDKEFEKMMNLPEDAEVVEGPTPEVLEQEPVEKAEEEILDEEPTVSPEPKTDDEPNVEQPNDSPVEGSEQKLDEEVQDEPEAGKGKDSTVEDQDESQFKFDDMPMDQLLPMEIAANGMKVRATMNELVEGFKKGMNYTQKMQELAPLRRSLSIVSSNDISEEDLNLLVEAKGGNKEALSKLMAIGGVDPLDVEADDGKEYTPQDYGKDEVDMDMDLARKEISADQEFGGDVRDAINTMPDDMYEIVSGNGANLKALHTDMQAGVYQKVMPEVMKLQTLYGKKEPTMTTYLKIAAQMLDDGQQEQEAPQAQAQSPEQSQAATQRSQNRKKAVSSSKSPAKAKSFLKEDIASMNDDDFEAEFKRMTGNSVDDYK